MLAAALRLLTRVYFLQRAMLIVLAALLSGLFIPGIVGRINESRDEKIALAKAQAKLFDEVSEILLTLQTLILDVSYFGYGPAKSTADQRRAYERYNEATPMLIARYRIQVARAKVLSSQGVANDLNAFLGDIVDKQDGPTTSLFNSCTAKCDWEAQHRKNIEMLDAANSLISKIGTDLHIGTATRQ